jgi:hypothetical protein
MMSHVWDSPTCHLMTLKFVKSCFNCRLRVREIAEECNTSIGSCHDILTTKLEMHQIVSKWGGQNNRNTNKLRNTICVGYIERTPVGNTECSSIHLCSVLLVISALGDCVE